MKLTPPHEPSKHRRYMTDENIGRSVMLAIQNYPREVVESRYVSPGAADIVLERHAAQKGLVLVSHDRDFKSNASKKYLRELRRSAPTIHLSQSPDSAKWIVNAIPIIEHQIEWAELNQLVIRVIRIKQGVINVEFAF